MVTTTQTPYLDLWANQEFVERLGRIAEAQEQILLLHDRDTWEPFRVIDGAVTDSAGAATVAFVPCPVGWEWRLERIAVSVDGASSAATLAAYVNANDDLALVDWAAGLFGNSPSRNISDNPAPIYLADGEQFLIVVAGAAVTQRVNVRVQGVRRMLTHREGF